jgi:hypothetical protein
VRCSERPNEHVCREKRRCLTAWLALLFAPMGAAEECFRVPIQQRYCGVGLPAILSPTFSVPCAVSLAATLVPWPMSLPAVSVPFAVL